jgi:hypothetical protein
MLIPRQLGEPWPLRDRVGKFSDSDRCHGEWRWPTVDETLDAIAAMRADTVLQILRGQAITYGLGAAVGSDVYDPRLERLRAREAIRRRKRKPRPRKVRPPAPVQLEAPPALSPLPAQLTPYQIRVLEALSPGRRICVWCFRSVLFYPDGRLYPHPRYCGVGQVEPCPGGGS